MKNIVFIFFAAILLLSMHEPHRWGFFGHKRINRLAVFSLPPDMMVFYKKHINYLEKHAVDPDMRRYIAKKEGIRHHIDLDHFGTAPFPTLPRYWADALLQNARIYIIDTQNDTLQLNENQVIITKNKQIILKNKAIKSLLKMDSAIISLNDYRHFCSYTLSRAWDMEESILPKDSLLLIFQKNALTIDNQQIKTIFWHEDFTQHGILPYYLPRIQRQLTQAFREKNQDKILRLSADIGHYIGDAHVPLHTTKNYNGQLTDQKGIHGFWETRLPALFADKKYDLWAGKANYIEKPTDFFWNVVLKSNTFVDSLLYIEKQLQRMFPPDRIFCFEQQNNQLIRNYCPEYAEAFDKKLNGQVEARMKATILAIASAWLTAWVDAGQPDLSNLEAKDTPEMVQKETELLENATQNNKILGREHEN